MDKGIEVSNTSRVRDQWRRVNIEIIRLVSLDAVLMEEEIKSGGIGRLRSVKAGVQQAWQEVIEIYLEPLNARDIHIEVRSDNGPQFCAKKLQQFFENNGFGIRTRRRKTAM